MRKILPNNFKTNSGQAILVVLLMITVVLTIGLSSVSRSITDIKTTQQSEESTRAFWVAQGNLENAIKANSTDITLNNPTNITSVVEAVSSGENSTRFVFDDAPNSFGKIGRDEYKVFWLINHNSDGSINESSHYGGAHVNLCFSSKAVEAVLFYKDSSSEFKYYRSAFDYDPAGNDSNFSNVSSGCGEISMPGSGGTPYLIVVKSHFMALGEKMALTFTNDGNPANTFVSQGTCFNSTATFTSSNIKRVLQECRTYPLPPLVFNNVLFSGNGGILK